jgi:hypothetical protein
MRLFVIDRAIFGKDRNGVLHEAPYSGLVISRQVTEGIRPNLNYFVYADDIEYTRKLSKRLGGIRISYNLRLEERELSWNGGSGSSNFLLMVARGVVGARLYYSIRNRAMLDLDENRSASVISRVVFRINYLITLAILSVSNRGLKKKLIFAALKSANSRSFESYESAIGRL